MDEHTTTVEERPGAGAGHVGLVDTLEVAAMLGCSVSTVKRLVASGAVPVIKIGRLVRFRERDVAAMIDAFTASAPDPSADHVAAR